MALIYAPTGKGSGAKLLFEVISAAPFFVFLWHEIRGRFLCRIL